MYVSIDKRNLILNILVALQVLYRLNYFALQGLFSYSIHYTYLGPLRLFCRINVVYELYAAGTHA